MRLRLLVLALLGTLLQPASATTTAPAVPLTVLLPPGYSAAHRYPVVFVLNAVYDDCRPACTAVERAFRGKPYVTVFENRPSALSDYVDWHDGSQRNEAAFLSTIRWVDQHYATSTRRDLRTIVGVSAGGYGAMLLAAHHPALFGHVASFSGPLDLRGSADANEPAFVVTGAVPPDTGVTVFGRPVIDDASWKANNPADLVGDLRSTEVYQTASPDIPCSASDNPVGVEPLVLLTNDQFDARATRAGVRHTYVRRSCGTHGDAEFLAEVQAWLSR